MVNDFLIAPPVGSIIRHSFLWSTEASKGLEEGQKDRPVCIILSKKEHILNTNITRVFVLPITHTEPDDSNRAVLVDTKTRKSLGLDDEDCWIICNEINYFGWPGHDIRYVPASRPKTKIYGMIPKHLLDVALSKLQAIQKVGKAKITNRDT